MTHNPYEPPREEREPVEVAPAHRLPAASTGKRFGGAVIDSISTFFVATAISHGIAGITGGQRTPLFVAACMLVPFAVQWFLLAQRGQTIGKILLGMRVVRLDGSAPGFVHAVALRAWPIHVVGLLPLLTSDAVRPFVSVLTLADSVAIFVTHRRCLHDIIAGTYVADVSADSK